MEPFNQSESQRGMLTSVGAMAAEWGGTAVRRHFQAAAELRAAKAAILVEVFQRRAGRLPSDMAEAASALGAPLPEDPFSAAGLLFRKTGAGYVVYSVGVNGVDDGGDDSAEASRPDVAFEVHLQAAARQVGGRQ